MDILFYLPGSYMIRAVINFHFDNFRFINWRDQAERSMYQVKIDVVQL